MKTDLEKFKELYESLLVPIEFVIDKNDGTSAIILEPERKTKDNDLIRGYAGFYTMICFDNEGKFLYQTIEE